jgi:hypothetical protein
MSWVERLERELVERRVPCRSRRRILLELEDHVASHPESVDRLGDPARLAQEFADDLAASESQRAALGSFVVLVPVGIAFAACFLAAATFPPPAIDTAETLALALPAALGMVLAPQVALAAGLLALLGWLRTRQARDLPAAEASRLCARATVALAAGAATLASLGLYAFELRAGLPTWWTAAALAVSVCAVVPVVAVIRVRRHARIRSTVPGDAGDVFDDLRVPSLRRPWLLCALVAIAAALAVGVAGGPDEGVRNAVLELLAVTGGFTLLGRPLGLRA